MSNPKVTISTTTAWDVDVKPNFKSLLKSVVSFSFLKPDKGITHLIDGFSVSDTIERAAWKLVYLSLRSAMVELVDEGKDIIAQTFPPKEGDMTSEELAYEAHRFEELVNDLKTEFEESPFDIDYRFLVYPEELPILTEVKELFETWLIKGGLSKKSASFMGTRLKYYFAGKVFHSLKVEGTGLGKLVKYLELTPEQKRLQGRKAYQQRIVKEWVQPIFDENFGLEDIYIQIRAMWQPTGTNQTVSMPSIVKKGSEEEEGVEFEVGDAEEHLWEWLNGSGFPGKFVVIKGGPGSGKSSLMKKLAFRLVQEDNFPVYFIPLQQFEWDGNLREMIKTYISERSLGELDPFDKDHIGKGRSPVLIFDGLDELPRISTGGEKAARKFVEKVVGLLRTFNLDNDSSWNVRAILAGREIVIEQAEEYSGEKPHLLELVPYLYDKSEDSRVRDFSEGSLELLEEDQREEWWQKYWKAVGERKKVMPKPLKGEEYEELTAQPLLNYLLARSHQQGFDFSKGQNLNEVYEFLIDSVRRPTWRPPGNNIPEKDIFFRFLEEVSIAAWHSGDVRSTSSAEILKRCKGDKDLKKLIESIDPQTGHTRLLTAFYFRNAEKKIDGGEAFEFTHKSFGEYLVARRIVIEMDEIADDLQRRRRTKSDNRPVWFGLTGPSAITENIWNFLKMALDVKEEEEKRQLYEVLKLFFAEIMEDGFNLGGVENHWSMQEQARNSLETLFLIVGTMGGQLYDPGQREPEWPVEFGLKNFFNYFLAGTNKAIFLSVFQNLKFPEEVDLSNSNLAISTMEWGDFSGVSMRKVGLYRSNLYRINLSNADLRKANFYASNFDYAFLFRADLSGARLNRANLESTNFNEAILNGTLIRKAYLKNAFLDGAYFDKWTRMEKTDFNSAHIDYIFFCNILVKGPDVQEVFAYLSGESRDMPDINALANKAKQKYGWEGEIIDSPPTLEEEHYAFKLLY